MEYVMVPVPEEILESVENYIRWEVGKPTVELADPEDLRRILGEFDVATREILAGIAEITLEGKRPDFLDVLETTELSERELVGTITEVNFRVREQLGLLAIVLLQPDPRPRPEGRNSFAHKILVMREEIAEQILG